VLHSIRDPDVPPSQQVEAVLDYYQPIFEKEYDEDYPKREPDLDHLAGLAANYESRQRFLESMALDPIELTALDQEAADEDEPPLVLSTIHSAKGLEFHTVFLIRALDGTIPSRHALRDDEEGIDEELRLFYVACTRAEENLFISYPMTQYRRSYGEYMTDPSRFVEDIPEEVLEPVQLVEEDSPEALEAPDEPAQLPDGEQSADTETEKTETTPSRPNRDPSDADELPF
jgi:DNA helicase-2/ATP-dependent DNA helicase PcrA